ncbi:MAG TPA: inositol 2-dehydrogenase [Steroidobacteraceae bacterium]|nr:inositol 2-dehydrogenase [Steroidobacteraceae bacterium]
MKTFALFGAGRIGRIHAANIAAHAAARLAYVVDVDTAAAASVAARAGAAVADSSSVLADARVDALLVASPTDTHADLIEAGAAARKAILCEKPVDLDVARARAAVAAAERAGILLAIGFNRRYDPSFRRIRDGIDRGEIGAVESVLIVSRDPSPPPVAYVRRSGGLFRDMTIHDLDMARWLLGEEPVEVTAHGSCLVDPAIGAAGDVDTAAVTLRTARGRIAQIANARRAAFGYDQRIEVCGALGMLAAGNRRATSVEHATNAGFASDPALPFFLERYADAYRLELDAFVRRLHGEDADLVCGADGVRALEIADACDRSLRERATVRLERAA